MEHNVWVEGCSDIHISISVDGREEAGILTDILYVPVLHCSLFSISSAAVKDIRTLYTRDGCQMTSDETVLMRGSLVHNLYCLDIQLVVCSQAYLAANPGLSTASDGT